MVSVSTLVMWFDIQIFSCEDSVFSSLRWPCYFLLFSTNVSFSTRGEEDIPHCYVHPLLDKLDKDFFNRLSRFLRHLICQGMGERAV